MAGTVINYAGVARGLGVSQPTAREYFQIAHGTFIWRHLPPYDRNVAKRVVKHPKGYLRDPGLLPIEIKYSQQVTARELRPIEDFIDEHRCPYGIVINNDERVRRYGENLLGIPFACC